MKTSKYQIRFYRDWVSAKGLHTNHIISRETDLQVLTDKKLDRDFVNERIRVYRFDIENYIMKDRMFLVALKPIQVELTAPAIIQAMNRAAKLANVGPMAAVAGAIAQFLGKDLLRRGYKEVIIENGGDIFLKVTRVRRVAIYTGRSKSWRNLGLKIRPKDTPMGICTSSGTIGHSLSFGRADSVVILSQNAILADAVATSAANLVQSKEDLARAANFTRSVKGISGAVIILGSNLTSWGKVEFMS